jgi:DcmR-like sensory protein
MSTVPSLNPGPAGIDVFWGEIAPCEHLVQLYDNGAVFLDALEGFIGGGLFAGDGTVVIATEAHLDALAMRLVASGVDLHAAIRRDQYIPMDADETLAKFMVGGWPDEGLFREVARGLISRARGDGRRVRAFGEMVALLWVDGNREAVVRLEQLWHDLCEQEAFSLFCAYPKAGFTQRASISAHDICALHSRIVS